MLKKGDVVLRVYGYQNGTGVPGMKPGQIGTVAEDQSLRGLLRLEEFEGFHDPNKFVAMREYPDIEPQMLYFMFHAMEQQNFKKLIELFRAYRKEKA